MKHPHSVQSYKNFRLGQLYWQRSRTEEDRKRKNEAHKARQNGTIPTAHKKCERWSSEDDEFLKAFYLESSELEMAKILGRTWESIKSRRKKLGLRKMTVLPRIIKHQKT